MTKLVKIFTTLLCALFLSANALAKTVTCSLLGYPVNQELACMTPKMILNPGDTVAIQGATMVDKNDFAPVYYAKVQLIRGVDSNMIVLTEKYTVSFSTLRIGKNYKITQRNWYSVIYRLTSTSNSKFGIVASLQKTN